MADCRKPHDHGVSPTSGYALCLSLGLLLCIPLIYVNGVTAGQVDLSGLSPDERRMIERACAYQQLSGPAAYYSCVRNEANALSKQRITTEPRLPPKGGSTAATEALELSDRLSPSGAGPSDRLSPPVPGLSDRLSTSPPDLSDRLTPSTDRRQAP